MAGALQRAWLRRGPLACLLWPVSLLLHAAVRLRRAFHRRGWLASHRLPVPVIVVGNVVAGGAGKTPVVLALLEHLKSRGLAAAVVSRGYGRTSRGVREVQVRDEAALTGDEPLLIRRRGGVPVFVGESRVVAAQALLSAYPGTQVIVSDDGLQHLAMARDVEVCVFDERGTGNGWLLPAGPLREPWPRPVDFVLRAGHEIERRLATHAVRGDGARIELAQLRGRPLHALAGIARPEAFFAMLRESGLTLARCEALPDHYDFDSYSRNVDAPSGLICTEKDAVKLWRTQPQAWAVPLVVRIDPAFFDALDAKLSSPA
jgi:tetraacyldisaccharide 4'-kinase